MRILVANVNTTVSMTDSIALQARTAATAGTVIVGITPRFGAASCEGNFESYLAAVAVMDAVLSYARPFDAVIQAGYSEHGREGLRELLEVPVVDITEAAASTAMFLGHKYSVVPPEPELGKELGLSRAPLREASVHWCTDASSSHAKATARSWPPWTNRKWPCARDSRARTASKPSKSAAALTYAPPLSPRNGATRKISTNSRTPWTAVVDAAHNQLLAGIYGSLAATVYGSWTSRAGLDRAAYAGHDNHDELFEAIRDGSMQDAMLVAGAILDNQASDLENT